MADPSTSQVTRLLHAWSDGDASALDQLIPLVYADLRRVAGRRLRRDWREGTLSATGLVHETYLRLLGQRAAHWRNRGQFFAVAAELMRRILVDHARRRAAAKRGSGLRLALEDAAAAEPPRDVDLIALDHALTELGVLDARPARVVEMRFFGGLSNPEVAEALGVSHATVERDWGWARAWLRQRLGFGAAPPAGA
jgi:RNA polymerase sigma factor (TIGR02999 family)